jgi:hypothetical protein
MFFLDDLDFAVGSHRGFLDNSFGKPKNGPQHLLPDCSPQIGLSDVKTIERHPSGLYCHIDHFGPLAKILSIFDIADMHVGIQDQYHQFFRDPILRIHDNH